MTEIDIYFKFLIAVIKADGKIEQEEKDFVINSAKTLGLSDDFINELEDQIVKEGIGIEQLYQDIFDKSDLGFTINLLKDGYALAKSDGNVDHKELDILKNMMKSYSNYSDSLFDELIGWCEESIYLKNVGLELMTTVVEA